MNNFTKEYIELCKCKEVQELRPKLKHGDWYFLKAIISGVEDEPRDGEALLYGFTYLRDRENIIWLPTGDQLDEEIIKICTGKEWDYYFIYDWNPEKYYSEIKQNYRVVYSYNDTNPLIARLKLLLQLMQ